MGRERRSEKRYAAKDGAIGAFFPVTSSDSFLVGQIVDISRGGLSLRYFTNGQGNNPPPRLDIFGSSRPLIYIGNVPGEIVYDHEVVNVPGSNFKIKQCGVQFGKLSKSQLSNLNYFMQNYASEPAGDMDYSGVERREGLEQREACVA